MLIKPPPATAAVVTVSTQVVAPDAIEQVNPAEVPFTLISKARPEVVAGAALKRTRKFPSVHARGAYT